MLVVVTATLRATAQLAAVGVVIVAVFRTPALAPLYLLVMLTAAVITHLLALRVGVRRPPTA